MPGAADLRSDPEQAQSGIGQTTLEGTGSTRDTTSAAFQLAPGTVLDGKLRIDGVLGRGGMGIVYLAHHLQLSRRVALKLTTSAPTEGGRARMLHEARAMARITHEHVVTVYDVGTIGEKVFIAMEYLDAGTARTWLADAARSWRDIVALYVKAGQGLAAAHAHNVIHRDFKADNVLVGSDGRVRVADFGLASVLGRGDVGEPATCTAQGEDSAVQGTPAYMAPEQFEGRPADALSDQFSFCVSLFEALFGRRPFAGTNAAEVYGAILVHTLQEPAANAGVPAHVRRALERGLSIDPKQRFPTMDALVRELPRDPAARLRGRVAAVIALGGTALGTWMIAHDDAQDPCAGSDALLVGLWDPAIAARLEQAFTATGVSYAGVAWEHTQSHLQAYANAWVAAHREACRATRVDDSQSETLMDLRMACLQRRRTSLASMVQVLSEPTDDVVRNAVSAAAELPGLQRCADANALREIGTIPEEHQAAASALRAQLALASAYLDTGGVRQGQTLAEQALATSEEIGLPLLQAEARAVMTLALQRVREWASARVQARAGVAAAILARDDHIAAQLAARLVYIEGYQLRTSDWETWADLAEAWLGRIGSPPELRAMLLNNRALIARQDAHYEAAIGYLEQAMPLLPDRASREAIAARGILADTYRRMGDLEAALAVYEDNLRVAEATLGAGHPLLAQELNNAGAVLVHMGRFVQATAYFERALQIRTDVFGEESQAVGETLTNMALVATKQNDNERALTLLERARQVSEGASDSSMTLSILANLAATHAKLGHVEASIALQEAVIERGEQSPTTETRLLVDTRYNLALAELGRDNSDRASALVARALEDLRESGSEEVLSWPLLITLRGRLHRNAGELEAALADFRLALDALDGLQFKDFPYRFEPLREAGATLLALDRPLEATQYLQEALAEATPPIGGADLASVQCDLARARLAAGDRSGARKAAQEARALVPDGDRKAIAEAEALIRAAR